ncbi:adenylate kinase family protein, partial [Vibrio splendidus]
MNIVLFGKPTCGKGTLAKKLESKGYFILGGSDVLRENSQSESATYYKEARHALDSGVLISSELINLMMSDKVSQISDEKDIVLDGYPRTIEQAEHMLKLFPRGTLK